MPPQAADFPLSIRLDPRRPGRAYASGTRSINNWPGGIAARGEWGYGGGLYSLDGGETWREDAANPFQPLMHSVGLDYLRPCKLWYATMGGGLMLGPAPPGWC